ncbi:HupE/UreJ family protein [Labilithrix luteola]|nr:HupE/UreJ family protein [Labilithrix luteola]
MASVLAAVTCLVVALFSSPACAHAVGISRGEYAAREGGLFAKLVFARAEIAALVPSLDANHDGHVTAQEVQLARPDLLRDLLARILVTSRDDACAPTLLDSGLVEEDGLSVSALFACAAQDAPIAIDVRALGALAPGHRHVARILGSTSGEVMLSSEQPSFMVEPFAKEPSASTTPAPPSESPPRGSLLFFRMGIEHILTGWDHLVFLLGLVLLRARARSLAAVVTAFTVGHSVTLALAVTGLVVPSARLVEPAIALSIAYVGVDNFVSKDGGKRWRITLPFGLVHGFGFAGALRALELPRTELASALVSFNLGVEAGQLAILLLLVPSLERLRRQPWFEPRIPRAVSAAIVVAGIAWFVARVTG